VSYRTIRSRFYSLLAAVGFMFICCNYLYQAEPAHEPDSGQSQKNDTKNIAVDWNNILASVGAVAGLLGTSLAILGWKAAHHAARISAISLYSSTNQFLSDNAEIINPLTPYKLQYSGKSQDGRTEVLIRTFLLEKLNMFRFYMNYHDRKCHIEFRKKIIGNSLYDFSRKIMERGGTVEFAAKAVYVLKAIYDEEPYFSKRFWRTFFRRFIWEMPSLTSAGAHSGHGTLQGRDVVCLSEAQDSLPRGSQSSGSTSADPAEQA
jgi:hypothetical protein